MKSKNIFGNFQILECSRNLKLPEPVFGQKSSDGVITKIPAGLSSLKLHSVFVEFRSFI